MFIFEWCFLVSLFGISVSEPITQEPRPSVLDGSCNPYVDIVFVLDRSSNITDEEFDQQIYFINLLLKDHKAPPGAVNVAVIVCGDNTTTIRPFTDDISPNSPIYLPPSSNLETDTSRHCFTSLNLMFKTRSRDGVARQAVILRKYWDWNHEQANMYAQKAKEDNTVVVVIAIDVRKFDNLSSLQVLATSDATYFVLPDFHKLKDLATVLAKDNCKPISLDLTSETREQLTSTTTQSVQRDSCIQLTDTVYKRYISGFGYTRLKCLPPRNLNLDTCNCV